MAGPRKVSANISKYRLVVNQSWLSDSIKHPNGGALINIVNRMAWNCLQSSTAVVWLDTA